MKKIYILVAVASIMALSACGWTRKSLGLAQSGPDETLVQTNKPLILPPEYNVRPNTNLVKSVKDTDDAEAEPEDITEEDASANVTNE